MTVGTTSRVKQYTGDGSTVTFAVPFQFFELDVYLGTALVSTSDYSITQTSPGLVGSVTFNTAPGSGVTVTIASDTVIQQQTDYVNNDSFPAESHELALDRITMAVADLKRDVTNSLVSPVTTVTPTDWSANPQRLVKAGADGGFEPHDDSIPAGGGVVTVDEFGRAGFATLDSLNNGTASLTGSEIKALLQAIGAVPYSGFLQPWIGQGVPTGWVLADGKTIGGPASLGTARANDDTVDLFTVLWDSCSDAVCPVSGGRGASAAADFAASKTITLPDLRGRAFFGLDNMGGAAASRLGAVLGGTTNGESGGTETVTLTTGQIPAHSHDFTTDTDGAHQHQIEYGSKNGTNGGDQFSLPTLTGLYDTTELDGAHAHSGTTDTDGGSGQAHSNMPPAFVGSWLIKL